MPIKLVLADEQPVVRDGLTKLFEQNFKILARCRTGQETLLAVCKHRPDILVLDLHLPIKNGLDVLSEIAKHKLPTRSVIFSAELSDDDMLQAIRLGASGVILKDMPVKLLIKCIKQVHAGQKWFEPEFSARVLHKLSERNGTGQPADKILSSRQAQIARMVAGGLRNKDIGKKLFISEGTVQIHLHKIYEKLDLQSRVALALYARDKGLV